MALAILDNLKYIEELDKEKMADYIATLPKQCLIAYQESQKIKIEKTFKNITNVVISGMGGSAIAGDLVKTIIDKHLSFPILTTRDWSIPNFINENSLVILVSYSGKTKETLKCFAEAKKRKAKIVVITSGGELENLARKSKISSFIFKFPAPPRASLGYLITPILVILEKIGLIDLKLLEFEESIKLLAKFNQQFSPNVPTEKNIAKYLAYFCFDHLPFIISSPRFEGIARRWKTQFNENSKNFAFWETLPEGFHNLVEGDSPWRLKDELVFLIFETSFDQPEYQNSLKNFKEFLNAEEIRWEVVLGLEKNSLTFTLSLVILGDWVSFYLAMLNQVDPTPVEKINWLKKKTV